MDKMPNRIADYVDYKTGALLFSIPFYTSDPNHAGGRPYKPDDPYFVMPQPKKKR